MTSTETTEASSAPSTPEITLDAKQEEAVNLCCDITKRVAAITGAAGSGKTTVLRKIHKALTEAGYSVVLCSPTGKAAKRIYEVTGIEAITIHRLLEYTHPGEPDPKTGKPVQFSYPKRTRSNPLENVDVVLADEYAMVNNDVHRSLFDALPNGACVRVFGDNNQLPPIEEKKHRDDPDPISPFNMLLQKFPSVVLDTVHRQGADSGILLNLQAILRGRMPTRNAQWDMSFTDKPVDTLRDLILDGIDNGHDFTSIENQILTPQNTTWVGTVKLNAMIQSLFRTRLDPAVLIPRHAWVKGEGDEKGGLIRMYQNDKVIITQNMYDLHVFNGETGRIIEITHEDELILDLGDREVTIPPVLMVLNRYGKIVEVDPRKNVDLAYAITTHKSQGSEYKRVIYMLNKSTVYMQNRKNFYTATSRGREHVHIITDQRSIQQSIHKQG
jgi:exodeoxyribonuclease V alpha subunit